MIDRDNYNYGAFDEYYQQPEDDGLLELLEAEEREAEEQAAMQMKPKWDYSGSFVLQPPEGYESDEDSLGELSTNGSGIDIDVEEPPF